MSGPADIDHDSMEAIFLTDVDGGEDTANQEWSTMSDRFINAGYREGITAGKEANLQTSFDQGFADIGAPIGRHLGLLRGLAAGVLAHLESSKGLAEGCEQQNLLDTVKGIYEDLARIQFSDMEPPDPEALEHAGTHHTSPSSLRMGAYQPQNHGIQNFAILHATLFDIIVKLGLQNLSRLDYGKVECTARCKGLPVERKFDEI